MWRDVPFARQRRPIIGVLRMCWLLPGSFDCFCCPHTSVHRPSIACLAVFLCGPGALFPQALSGPSTICAFPPHGWSAPNGLPLLLRKQPIWAAGGIPHLMPVEQGLPWHPVATGLAGQAIPFTVDASHAHAPPSAPFWFPVPAVLVPPPPGPGVKQALEECTAPASPLYEPGEGANPALAIPRRRALNIPGNAVLRPIPPPGTTPGTIPDPAQACVYGKTPHIPPFLGPFAYTTPRA